MKQDKLMIIDGNSLLNRAYFAIPPLNSFDGKNVNAVFGFVNILFKALSDIAPSHLIVAFDEKGKNFRHEIYTEYKANRKGMPDDLAQQMPILFELVDKMNITRVSQSGVEADDVIGTLSKRFKLATVIVTGDRDMLQLIDDSTEVMLTKKGITDVELVTQDNMQALYQMSPSQVIEFKALKGDTADNIPGVSGIGDKTAVSLISEFGDVDTIYQNIEKIKGSVQAKLLSGRDAAYMSRQLATIDTDLLIDCKIEDCVILPFKDCVREEFEKLQFRSLFKKLNEFSAKEKTMEYEEKTAVVVKVENENELANLIEQLKTQENLCFEFAENIWVSSSTEREYEILISHDLFGGITFDKAIARLEPLLSGASKKTVYDSKQVRHMLSNFGVELKNVEFDISIMQYLVEYRSFKDFESLKLAYNLKSNTVALLQLAEILHVKLNEISTWDLYKNIELPLSLVLFETEQTGCKIDMNVLNDLGERFKGEIEKLSEQAYELAGEKFNILSPKQLSAILFDKLHLTAVKKTKTGFSTDNDVLEKLAVEHPIAGVVSEIRKISKLSGTYIEGMRPLVTRDNLVHTKFNQTLTSTGRLSSSEPNLQNIPVRGEEGKEVRKMFVPMNDMLVSADYSQIELRLLAHFSGDENLIKAFNDGKDIHALVASEIFEVPENMVSSSMRRMAKAVNFGIIYGISEFGLSQNIGISPTKARQYIKKYFESYPKIKQYLNGSVEFAKDNGYVVTVSGRRRQIPEIKSTNFQMRSFGERAAMNMPLQGSAADIIKIAMLNVANELKRQKLNSKLILQVHDELILDVVKEEKERIFDILKTQMSDCFKLKVSLDINIESGNNLYETK